MTNLALYLSAVIFALVPSMRAERRESIATDIAAVAAAESRAFEDDEDGHKTGLLLVSIAHYETGRSWSQWVDDGSCNDPVWRARHPLLLEHGDCDSGKAAGLWQVHTRDNTVEGARELARDRKAVIRAALLVARDSLQRGAGLCGYTGETFPRCPLGDRRLGTAREWMEKYPFPLPME